MKHVLVTGCAGFIGSHTTRRLLGAGTRVRGLDNFDPFYDVSIKRRRLEQLAESDAFEFLEGDIRDADACRAALEGVDGVIHFAALAGVRPSMEDPVRYMDVNVTGTQILLKQLEGRPDVPFVFISSSSVYGGNEKVPFSESDPVDHPVSPYAASKKAGEVVCHAFHHLHGNPVTCLRLFTVYGPGQRPEMAIHKFCRMITNGEAVPFFGAGDTARDYTYVEDIVDGVCLALERASGYAIYNLGGLGTTTLAELVATIERALGKTAILERLPEQPGDMRCTHADISLARRELGYQSRVGIEEGVQRFADWYRQERSEGRLL